MNYLVNNAGDWSWGRLQDTDIDGLERLVDTNVLAPLRLTKALLPQLAAARGGVLFMASLAALVPTPAFATYGASKAFLASLALGLHEECRADGVMSCVVFPGVVRTEFTSPDAETLWYRALASAPETVARASYRGFLWLRRSSCRDCWPVCSISVSRCCPRGSAREFSMGRMPSLTGTPARLAASPRTRPARCSPSWRYSFSALRWASARRDPGNGDRASILVAQRLWGSTQGHARRCRRATAHAGVRYPHQHGANG